MRKYLRVFSCHCGHADDLGTAFRQQSGSAIEYIIRKLEDLEERGRQNETQQRQLVEDYLEARNQRLSISPKETYLLLAGGSSFDARTPSIGMLSMNLNKHTLVYDC